MPLVYLDNCALQRPLDDRVQLRVRLEAEAVEAVLREIGRGTVDLLISDVLVVEGNASPDRHRREFAGGVRSLSAARAPLTQDVERQALPYQRAGMKAVDSLHLASAVVRGADYFCTTDDRFLRKARAANTAGVRVVTPTELATALGL